MTNITNKKIYIIEFNRQNSDGKAFSVKLKNIPKVSFSKWMRLKGTGREFYTTKEEVLRHVRKLKKEGIQFQISLN